MRDQNSDFFKPPLQQCHHSFREGSEIPHCCKGGLKIIPLYNNVLMDIKGKIPLYNNVVLEIRNTFGSPLQQCRHSFNEGPENPHCCKGGKKFISPLQQCKLLKFWGPQKMSVRRDTI